jgi:hypothetical protein
VAPRLCLGTRGGDWIPSMFDTDSPAPAGGTGHGRPDWIRSIAVFSRSDTRKALWQLINTLVLCQSQMFG